MVKKVLMVKNLFWLWCQHVTCSRLYTADLHIGTINILEPVPWHQHLYPGIEDIGVKCLQQGCESSLHISTCCNLFQPGASYGAQGDENHWTPYCQPNFGLVMMLQLCSYTPTPPSPNEVLTDFFLPGPVKKHLTGKWFAIAAGMKQAITS
jgi:hypothetical protein